MKNDLLLAIETSSVPSSVSVLEGTNLLEQLYINDRNKTSSHISKTISDLLRLIDVYPTELSGIAISEGPGSFTGLRVGMATAKGLSYALEVPLYPVDTLMALSLQFSLSEKINKGDRIVAMLNARRGNVFAGTYTKTLKTIVPPRRVAINTVLKQSNEKQTHFISSDANELVSFANKKVSIKPVSIQSYYTGFLAQKTKMNRTLREIAYLEPNYLINNYIKQTNG